MNGLLNKISCGNSVDLMKLIPDNSIDLTITSPPYDNLRTYKDKIKDGVVFDEYFSFPFVDMSKELFRITKDGGIVVWVVNDQIINGGESGTSFRQALKFQEIGFKIYDTMIYHKNGAPFPETGRYSQVFEYMFVFLKGKKPNTVNIIKDKENKWAGVSNFGKRSARTKEGEIKKMENFTVSKFGSRYNVWYINNGAGWTTKDKYAYDHPAMFPESLAEDHILSWSKEGDVVFDPMCGSGTTPKMAKLNNRNFIGFDINQEYVNISNKRIDGVIPYDFLNPNPKSKFILSRENALSKRKNNRKVD
jgi:DNA modification methylase